MVKEVEMEREEDHASNFFPEAFPISLTHGEFPSSFEKIERSGLPFGAVITPFIARNDEGLSDEVLAITSGSKVARCGQCAAYMNPFCDATPLRWFCALCNFRNHFSKSQSRYVHKNNTPASYEECENIMSDYPMPFRGIDGAPASCRGKFAIPASQRPLVHVFLVQESMQLDCLKAVVESLNRVVEDMHPDVKVVLLSYSNRVGVHRLGDNKSPQRVAGAVSEVQYVQLAGDDGRGAPLHRNQSAMPSGGSSSSSSAIAAVCPIGVVADFLSTAKSIGDCREDLQAALSDLCSSHNCYVESNVAYGGNMPPEMACDNGGGDGNNGNMRPQPLAENMVCPVLDEVCQWICEETDMTQLAGSGETVGTTGGLYAGGDSDDDDDFYGGGNGGGLGQEEEEEGGGVFGLLTDIGLGLIGAAESGNNDDNNGSRDDGGNNDAGAESGDVIQSKGPVDKCSGVILHLFVGGPQDLPPGTHPSARQQQGQPGQAQGTSCFWSEDLAHAVAVRGLSINVWGVSSFEGNSCDLLGLGPLAKCTGGTINRAVLGAYPEDQKTRLKELLRRSVSSKQISCRGVLKVRASPCVQVLDESLSGHVHPDEHYPEVYHMAQCTPDSSVGFQIEYKNVDPAANLNPEDRGNKVAFQMAFAYDTLVESPCTNDWAADLSADDEDEQSDPFIEELVEMLEVDRGHGVGEAAAGGSKTYRGEVDSALRALVANKRKMAREVKRNNLQRNRAFYLKHGTEILDGFEAEAAQDRSSSDFDEKTRGERERVEVAARHEMKKVYQGKATNYWKCAELTAPERRPEACCYDRRRRLVAVRRLRVFTVMVRCSNRNSRVISSIHPSTLSMLIVRQAISDESKFREALLRAQEEDQPVSTVRGGGTTISPGMHFVDGWAASVIASCAAVTSSAKENPSLSCQEALSVTCVLRTLQLLFGARKGFIDSRSAARAITYQMGGQAGQSAGMVATKTLQDVDEAVARIVADDFVEWACQLNTVSPRTAQRVLYPALYPLTPIAEPSTRGPKGDMVQWQVQHDMPLPLKWESLHFKQCHAFLLDTGNSFVLYKDSAPPALLEPVPAPMAVAAPPPTAPVAAVKAASPPRRAMPLPPPPPVLGRQPEPPKSTGVGFGFRALDVLGSLDRGVGHLLGDHTLDESMEVEQPEEGTGAVGSHEAPTEQQQGGRSGGNGGGASLDGLMETLSKEYHWLPYEAYRGVTFSPLVPSVVVTEKGTNTVQPFSSRLIEDTPDIMGDPYACESYGRFIGKACQAAEGEVKDLLRL
jgi:hypothetical protein